MIDFEEYAKFLAIQPELVLVKIIETAAKVGEAAKEIAAKKMIGHELSIWKPLDEVTIERKEREGFTGQVSATDPLLRTGEMRESISYEVIPNPEGATVIIGSSSKHAIYQELGTPTIPPRPFLSVATAESIPVAEKELGETAITLLTPKV